MSWLIWAVMLLLQNASFTWVSRARNSGSIKYHAIAAVGSNGIYILSLGVALDKLKHAYGWEFAGIALFYTVFTVLGSIGAHHFLMTKVEKGSRKVGA